MIDLDVPCPWCGCSGYHSEVCEGFDVNDPARKRDELGAPVLDLWAVGVDSSDPETWSIWSEVALVVAASADEAAKMADKWPGVSAVRVDLTKPGLLVQMPEPDWGDDL